jgi:hypothetical protein
MVEYLLDVADRKSIQSIFTTHSEDALVPLPPEAIWSSIDGRARQGKISIEGLRAITGRIDESMAIFVEDNFAKEWVESIVRNAMPERVDEIGVYAVSGDSQAASIHLAHAKNPAVSGKLKSICIVDGDSKVQEDIAAGIIKLPGSAPENEVFNYVRTNINSLSMKLAVGLHLTAEKDKKVKTVVEGVAMSNRDPHLLFNQVGQGAGLVAENIVSSAFIALWIEGNQSKAQRIANFVEAALS